MGAAPPFDFDALLDAIDGPALERTPERAPDEEATADAPVGTASSAGRCCDVYTPHAMRDAFFSVAGVRAQVARSSASTAYAARCVLVSKLVHVEFCVPSDTGAAADATLSVHVGSVYEAAL